MAERQDLVRQVRAYVEEYMNKFDGSHDFNHIKRVVGIAHVIFTGIAAPTAGSDPSSARPLDPTIITLAAMLHDVGDRKYLKEGQDPKTQVQELLLSFGADAKLAAKVQAICLGVSYTSEVQDPAHVRHLIMEHPELAVVQDADRLDAIGAVGIGRVFTYGGARTDRDMHESIDMMDRKLFKIASMMKTEPGKRMAGEATHRLRLFRNWWREEMGHEQLGLSVLGPAAGEEDAARIETSG
ncbi:Uncharacterized protein BUE80_DR013520 [Diplocarpon rosae]|nr:Uncharacterized protein BUE80_DR013520 [Diplocarpon rosae]